eukprot:TRINITY_DN3921_c0_g4_i1.p1 TRINITY_DN3921_c0_g4~~TRINITY_DN3921_c0_g4_i1.p1  ORF type:complete len:667 (-),score=74.66 TRINITY_DN3921_c0_g4_i1:100-2100(-)
MSDMRKIGRDVRVIASVEQGEVVNGGASSGKLLGSMKLRMSLTKSSGPFVEYTIRVSYDRKSHWVLKKRFSEIAALHEVLKLRLPRLPDLPAKTATRHFSAEYIEGRKNELAKYLAELCRQRDALNCREVHEFLGLSDNVAAFREPHGSEPVQAAEIHEASFGVTDFVYDPVQGLLLFGASDASWSSRVDTAITNIKLPWEASAPNLPSSQMTLWKQNPADLRFDMQFVSRYTPTISSVAMCPSRQDGVCLCGLSDGSIGCHPIKGRPGVTHGGGLLPAMKHTSAVLALEVDKQDNMIISVSKDTVLVYDAEMLAVRCEQRTSGTGTVSKVIYVEEQKRLFCGLTTGRVSVWDTSQIPIQQVATIPDGAEAASVPAVRISALDFDCVSNTLFTAGKDGLRLWAVKSSSATSWGRCVGQLSVANSSPTAVAWSSSSREMMAGFTTGAVVVFDTESGEPTYAFQAHSDEISKILWLDAPRRLLTASKDKTLKVWDFPSLLRTSLEDELGFTPSASPVVSTHSRVTASASTSGCGYPTPCRSTAGGDPLLGRGPLGGSASPSSDNGRVPADMQAEASRPSQLGPDPLTGSVGNRLSLSRASGTSNTLEQPAGSTAANATPLASTDRGMKARDSAKAPPTYSKSRHISGSKPGAYAGADSDSDDLFGWDK